MENEQIIKTVDALFEESDRRIFEILHRLAELAVATSVTGIDK